jgi:hypothetical protein
MKVVIEQAHDSVVLASIHKHLSTQDKITMADCIRRSNTMWIGKVDGEVVCIWGVSLPSVLSDRAYLWLWTTEGVKDHPFVFIRKAQIVVADLLKEYSVIVGHCVVGAKNSIRWLKWLGAKFDAPDGNLIPFQIRKKENG